jgi:C4-dicarboxylate-binding protein DctP
MYEANLLFRLRSSVLNAALVGAGLCLSVLVVTPAASQTTMKLATATVNDVQVQAIERFGAKVAARSNGKLKPEYYPGAQLGSNPRMIEGLQLGTIEVYVGPPAYLVGLDSRFQVLDAPGIFDDAEHFWRVSQDPEFRDAFLRLAEPKGLKGATLFMYSPTAFATRKPVRTLADFQGLKLRVLASRMERESVEKLGATAVPIDFSEVVSALQQGTIDGMKTGMSAFTALKIYDVVKYVTETNEAIIPEVLMISKMWFDRQPEDIKGILVEEGRAIERELFDWTMALQVEAHKTWKEHGGEIFQLSPEDRKEMRTRLAAVADDVLKVKPEDQKMFDLLKKTVERTRK